MNLNLNHAPIITIRPYLQTVPKCKRFRDLQHHPWRSKILRIESSKDRICRTKIEKRMTIIISACATTTILSVSVSQKTILLFPYPDAQIHCKWYFNTFTQPRRLLHRGSREYRVNTRPEKRCKFIRIRKGFVEKQL